MSSCSVSCKNSKADILGIGCVKRHLAVETRQPWTSNILQSIDTPPGLAELLKEQTKNKTSFSISGVLAPKDLFDASKRWVIDTSWTGHSYKRRYHHVPQKDLSHFLSYLDTADDFLSPLPEGEDVLLCIHGIRDQCCGTFGTELLHKLEKNPKLSSTRFWGTSHLGGHKYAPTMVTLSDMRYWGHLEETKVENILLKNVPFEAVASNYRGHARLEGLQAQFVERALLERYSWKASDALPEAVLKSFQIEQKTEEASVVTCSFMDQTHHFLIERIDDTYLIGSCRDEAASAQKQYKITAKSSNHLLKV